MKTPSESLQGTVQMTLRQVRPLGTTSPVPSHIHEDAPGVCALLFPHKREATMFSSWRYKVTRRDELRKGPPGPPLDESDNPMLSAPPKWLRPLRQTHISQTHRG